MAQYRFVNQLIASRKAIANLRTQSLSHNNEAEGGCGVIGIASSEKIRAYHLLQSLKQMRNRGNGKGGGIAAVGLVAKELGVSQEVLERDYLLTIAYLDSSIRQEVERKHIEPIFHIDYFRTVPGISDFRTIEGIDVKPPEVYMYFVRVKTEVVQEFQKKNGLEGNEGTLTSLQSIEDEIVYQNTCRLNYEFYASNGNDRAFVLSHGKNLIVLKMVGYGDDVIRYYQLEDLHAHVWIGHHRYPTKGRVWHPGGAHPFVGLHEALVHNGDFANYASISEYLAQRNIHPLFQTDTEVSVLVFDLLHRIYNYPLEYVIEALAPTTERDFTQLPEEKQKLYQMLQSVHIHGSPDGPWFFLIAQSAQPEQVFRLIGITDTSMLRPQVFALQQGVSSIGFAASEKQGIDAALESLAAEDKRFCTRADLYWNARGGSHTDGGAFIFTVKPNGNRATLVCTNKFGREITLDNYKQPYVAGSPTEINSSGFIKLLSDDISAEELFHGVVEHLKECGYDDVISFLLKMEQTTASDTERKRAIETLTLLIDRKYSTGKLRCSSLISLYDKTLATITDSIRQSPSEGYTFLVKDKELPEPVSENQTIIIDARPFPPEGENSLALETVRLYRKGFKKFILMHTRGHRFIANGFGPQSHGVRIDVFGSSGDYLGSGIDGAEVFVHGNGQDQLAQIMKDGKLVVYGDVGQTFMYAAKGGKVFVLGNAAGRPLINAVGKPRVVINGTCLDYLAESFMAGDPLNGGGFVILNGITFDDEGSITELYTPYPGGNLFSLASGGAIYIRDPYDKVSEDQLNGGEFIDFNEQDWMAIKPYLEENEQLFGIPLKRLLERNGETCLPHQIYRKIRPSAIRELQAEEAWVKEEYKALRQH
ncbi:MAG: glutamate synthase [Chloroflexi bacterium]|nr:glutamate synthase [Chloroflexota bacterium]